jgi:hypothetical protein
LSFRSSLLGGFSGCFGGYGYGYGHSGVGGIGIIIIILVVLLLMGRIRGNGDMRRAKAIHGRRCRGTRYYCTWMALFACELDACATQRVESASR